jgi:hypothetical protein
MAKSTKSQNPEFLQKRRSAIAELAKRRGTGRRILPRVSALGPSAKAVAPKLVGPLGYAVGPQPRS